MAFNTDLDRYLTTPPQSGYMDFTDVLFESFSEAFFDENEDWIMNTTCQCDKWIDRLYGRDYCPKNSAKLIERAFNIFIKPKNEQPS